MNWIIREQQREESVFNAGSKAREDVDKILTSNGFTALIANMEIDLSQNPFKKTLLQIRRYHEWIQCIEKMKKGDLVVIQFPVRNHTVFFQSFLKTLNKNGVTTVGIIHDLESLRQSMVRSVSFFSRLRFKLEEISALKYFSKIIVHNNYMKKSIHDHFDIPLDRMINLEIFDYLYIPENEDDNAVYNGPIIIAGNLDKRKSGYVYHLPKEVNYSLYGANYSGDEYNNKNVSYLGKVKPDELPKVLKGSFGLVWDGPSAKTCEGVYGEYLKVNNPHKTSLYLAASIPVIVWDKSAMADFVEEHGCGITVESINQIENKLKAISIEQYKMIVNNAKKVGKHLRNGYYMRTALSKINDC